MFHHLTHILINITIYIKRIRDMKILPPLTSEQMEKIITKRKTKDLANIPCVNPEFKEYLQQ